MRLYDLLLSAGLVGAGLLWGDRPRVLARGIAGPLLFLGVSEALARVALPPRFVPTGISWSLAPGPDPRHDGGSCGVLFPAEGRTWPDWWAQVERKGDRPAVLHVGDSMLVVGDDVAAPTPARFPGRLGAMDPEHRHVNIGLPGSGIDAHLAMVRAWLPLLGDVREVIVYHFALNDLSDMSRRWSCCPGGVVAADRPGAPSRCPRPTAADPGGLLTLHHRSGPPLVLRLALVHTRLAPHLVGLIGVDGSNLDDQLGPSEAEAAWGDVAVVLATMQQEIATAGASLVVVSLPAPLHDESVTAPQDQHGRILRMGHTCAGLEVPWIDARPAFASWEEEWFLPDTTHLSDVGHAHLADWLAPRLQALRARRQPSTEPTAGDPP